MPVTPTIGITAESEGEASPYCEVVRRAGGTPKVVLPCPGRDTGVSLKQVDGLLLSGGADLGPLWYRDRHQAPDFKGASEERDAMEASLLRAALERDMPVLGGCRGMQAINVAFGGSLISDLPGHDSSEEDGEEVSAYHRIYISPGSKLASIIGSGGFVRVNSLHHQGLKEAQRSPRLLASAYSLDDGVVEALESPDHDWVIGVQFHPERRKEVPPQFERLFQALVERAGGQSADRRDR